MPVPADRLSNVEVSVGRSGTGAGSCLEWMCVSGTGQNPEVGESSRHCGDSAASAQTEDGHRKGGSLCVRPGDPKCNLSLGCTWWPGL